MTFGNDCKVLRKDPDRYGGFQELMLSFSSRDPNAVDALTSSIWTLENYRSEGFPEQDIWSLGTLDQGSNQMERVLGKPPPSSPPSLGNSGRHSGQETIIKGFP